MTKLRITIPVLAIALALALPGLALASSSGQTGYQGPNSAVAGVNEGNNTSGSAPVAEVSSEEPKEESSETLPFTGSDIALLVGAGAILLALGFTLRRLTHRPTRS